MRMDKTEGKTERGREGGCATDRGRRSDEWRSSISHRLCKKGRRDGRGRGRSDGGVSRQTLSEDSLQDGLRDERAVDP